MWEAIVNAFVNALLLIYKLIGGNLGVAIILFTILIRLVTHPLMASQIKGSTKMMEFQQSKQWQDLQKKYKDDKEKLAQEQLKLQRELGINPFASCLPTLIQFPLIIALYQSVMRATAASPEQLLILSRVIYPVFNLQELIPLNSKFLWMNLGQPERVYLLGFGIPFLAIVAAVTTYIQSKVTLPPSTNPNDQSAMMNRSMTLMMPLMIGWFSLTYASGLSVYFIISNLVGIAQYALLGKVHWEALLPGKRQELQTQETGRKKK